MAQRFFNGRPSGFTAQHEQGGRCPDREVAGESGRIDHGQRSVTALPFGLDLNAATLFELLAIPGVGKKRAQTLISNRPHRSIDVASNLIETDLSKFVTIHP